MGRRYELSFSTLKTMEMVMKGQLVSGFYLNFGEERIKTVDKIKYLGIMIDQRMLYDSQVEYITEKNMDEFSRIRGIVGNDWGISFETALILYKAICIPRVNAVNMWLFHNYHQLLSVCGDVEYSEIGKILKSLHFECIYVKGEEKRQIIQVFLPNVKIHEMGEDLDCPRLDQLHGQLAGNIYYEPCFLYHKDLNRSQCTYD